MRCKHCGGPTAPVSFTRSAGAVSNLADARRAYGLDKPYGPGAVALGIGGARPVRARDAGEPADPTEPPESTDEAQLTAEGTVQPDRDAAHVILDDLPADPPF